MKAHLDIRVTQCEQYLDDQAGNKAHMLGMITLFHFL